MATNDPFALDPVPRRVTHLIFLVDTSGSMSGAKISSLNTAVREVLPMWAKFRTIAAIHRSRWRPLNSTAR